MLAVNTHGLKGKNGAMKIKHPYLTLQKSVKIEFPVSFSRAHIGVLYKNVNFIIKSDSVNEISHIEILALSLSLSLSGVLHACMRTKHLVATRHRRGRGDILFVRCWGAYYLIAPRARFPYPNALFSHPDCLRAVTLHPEIAANHRQRTALYAFSLHY